MTAQSPTPKMFEQNLQETMTFPEAMAEVIKGKKVTKLEWDDQGTYLSLSDFLVIHKSEEDTNHRLLVSSGDMMGEDWIIV